MAFYQTISLCIRFKVVCCFNKSNPCFLGEYLSDAAAEFGMSINPGANGGTTDREFQYGIPCTNRSFHGESQLTSKSPELLS